MSASDFTWVRFPFLSRLCCQRNKIYSTVKLVCSLSSGKVLYQAGKDNLIYISLCPEFFSQEVLICTIQKARDKNKTFSIHIFREAPHRPQTILAQHSYVKNIAKNQHKLMHQSTAGCIPLNKTSVLQFVQSEPVRYQRYAELLSLALPFVVPSLRSQ